MGKKKNKIKRLNSEEYNAYIMSLKDEEPIKYKGKDGNMHSL